MRLLTIWSFWIVCKAKPCSCLLIPHFLLLIFYTILVRKTASQTTTKKSQELIERSHFFQLPRRDIRIKTRRAYCRMKPHPVQWCLSGVELPFPFNPFCCRLDCAFWHIIGRVYKQTEKPLTLIKSIDLVKNNNKNRRPLYKEELSISLKAKWW